LAMLPGDAEFTTEKATTQEGNCVNNLCRRRRRLINPRLSEDWCFYFADKLIYNISALKARAGAGHPLAGGVPAVRDSIAARTR